MTRHSDAQVGDRREEEPMLTLLRCAFGRRMVEGEGEWRGVPDVLRSSFLLLVKEMQCISARLATLEAAAEMKVELDSQRLEQNSIESDENDSRQQQKQQVSNEDGGVLKRVQDVETVSRQAMDRVAVVEHMLQQTNEAAKRREARWKRRVGRLQDEIVNLVALAAASNQKVEQVTHQCDVFSCASHGGEEQKIDDSVPSSAGHSPHSDTSDVDNEVLAVDGVVQLCNQEDLINESVRTASSWKNSRYPAVDLRVKIPNLTPLNEEEDRSESHQQQELPQQAIERKPGCEGVSCSEKNDQRTNIGPDASISSMRETTAPPNLLSGTAVQGCSVSSSVEALETLASDSRFPSIDTSTATNGQRRLATLRARYAEARRKQQQSLSQLRAIGGR